MITIHPIRGLKGQRLLSANFQGPAFEEKITWANGSIYKATSIVRAILGEICSILFSNR